MHEKIMKEVIELAEKGRGYTNPNPIVGAIIIKNGEIIGKGCHEIYGGPHAEINAISSCTKSPEGASMYVSLEPCSHTGKTGPCTEAIIKSGIKEVFIGALDENPKVSGVNILKDNGIRVVYGILEEEVKRQNEIFFHYIRTNMPFVLMKYAMTMDGKIATKTGESRYVSCKASREHSMKLRHQLSSIMVGKKTVISDDPMLNCRIENAKQPVRIVCDTNLSIPSDAKVLKTANEFPTLIATASTDIKKQEEFLKTGCEILNISKKDGHLDLKDLMKKLGERKIDSVLLEGGGELNFSALESGIVNKIRVYVAPKIFGGKEAISPVSGLGALSPDDAFKIRNMSFEKIDEDIMIEGEII